MTIPASYVDHKKPLPLIPNDVVCPARLEAFRKTKKDGTPLKDKFDHPMVLAGMRVLYDGDEYIMSQRLSPRIGYDADSSRLYENFVLVVTGAESITDALQVDDDTYVGARFKIRIGCTQKDDGAIYWDVREFIPIGAPSQPAAPSAQASKPVKNGSGGRAKASPPAAPREPAQEYEPA